MLIFVAMGINNAKGNLQVSSFGGELHAKLKGIVTKKGISMNSYILPILKGIPEPKQTTTHVHSSKCVSMTIRNLPNDVIIKCRQLAYESGVDISDFVKMKIAEHIQNEQTPL
jgi:hypothetical protein